jgi:hypothetical protein
VLNMGAILHSAIALEAPDWSVIREMVPETAAKRLRSILCDLDPLEKQVFALRGMCALLIEERELYKWVMDEEVGDYYVSFDRFLKCEFPNSWSYIRDALRAVKELKEVPFEDLLSIRRCNLEQLKRVSSGVRVLPEVIKAAKSLPEKEFVGKLNEEHAQHLEVRQPVIMASPTVSTIIDQAIEIAMALEGCKSRETALEAIAAYFVMGCQGSYEKFLKEHTA